MATAWEVDTAVYEEKFKDVGTQDTSPYGIAFSLDGTKMYIIGGQHDTVYQYTLSTPWDVGTATYAEKYKDIGDEDIYPNGIAFSLDGTKMYIVGGEHDTVYQYTLSTPWDVGTATYAEKFKDVGTQDTDPREVDFSSDGSKMYVVGTANKIVSQYTLSTPWDVGTAEYAARLKDVSAEDTSPRGIAFRPNGTKMYIIGGEHDTVYQYDLPVTDFEYTGTGSLTYSGEAISSYSCNYLYEGSGRFVLSGEAICLLIYNFLKATLSIDANKTELSIEANKSELSIYANESELSIEE